MKKAAPLFVVLLVAFACSKSEPAAQPPASNQQTATTATATVAPATQPTTTAPAPVAAAPTAGAIASSDGEKSGSHIDVTELKRTSGGTINLKFVLSNNGSETLHMSSDFMGDSHVSRDAYRGISGIHLLDPVNKKKYFVVTDAEKNCVCSKDVADIQPGSKANLWAKFPAPPPEVQKITIEIPHFAPIDDAPISQ